jgi:HK97 family phage major capsid protein/HK97 family phage prohead protease
MKIEVPISLTAADTNKRTISGRIVTWGEQGNTSAGATVFAPDSIKFNKNVKLLLEHDRTRPIGKLLAYEINDEGIDATFKVANTMAGEDALVEASDGLRDGFSVGVKVDAWDNKDGVMVITSSKIIETSLVTDPAINSARVAEVAAVDTTEETKVSESTDSDVKTEGEQVSDTTVPETPAVTEAVEGSKVEAAAPKPAFYTSPRSPIVSAGTYLEHTIKASLGDDESRQYVKAADDTASNTGLTLAPHMNEFNTNTISGRPAVDSVSKGVLPASGMSFTLPKLSQAPSVTIEAENGALGGDEMTSTYITVDVKKAAGIQTISWELLDRSSPAFYDQLIRELNDAYAKYTDTAMIAAFTASGTQAATQAATIAGLKAYIAKEVPAAYKAAGKFATNLVVNTAWWETILAADDTTNRPLFTAAQPQNSPGSVSGQSITGQVLGLNLAVDPHMAVTTLIDESAFIVAPDAFKYYEAPKTTLQVQALANGQLQVAMYGYYAIAPIWGGGVRRFNLT